MEAEPILCPSSRCEKGALLLGVILANGSLSYAQQRITVDQEFVDSAAQGRSPERRFRFSSPCVKCACKQWAGDHCSVIGKVLSDSPVAAPDAVDLPQCSIRKQCRWFAQEGAVACGICPLVITDLREDVAEECA